MLVSIASIWKCSENFFIVGNSGSTAGLRGTLCLDDRRPSLFIFYRISSIIEISSIFEELHFLKSSLSSKFTYKPFSTIFRKLKGFGCWMKFKMFGGSCSFRDTLSIWIKAYRFISMGTRNMIPDKVSGPPTPVLNKKLRRRKRKVAATRNGNRSTRMPRR